MDAAPLLPALRSGFLRLETGRGAWRAALAACGPLVGSAGSLAQQLRALGGLRLGDTPLRAFPDLQARLQARLLQTLDLVLQDLQRQMGLLQAVRDAISDHTAAALQLYERGVAGLDLTACTRRSAAAPSVADMLEWLQNAERHYRRQFLKRKTLLQSLRPEDLALLEATPTRWEALEDPRGEEYITDSLLRVSLFVESQRGE